MLLDCSCGHVRHLGLVTHSPCHYDVDLIFDCTSLGAVTDPAKSLAVVCARGNKQISAPASAERPGGLWKLYVITHEDRDPAVLCMVDVEAMPPADLVGLFSVGVKCTFFWRKTWPFGVKDALR